MKFHKTILCALYFGILAAGVSQGAAAQTADAGNGAVTQIETVVVTAEKRAENAQDVPVAITTLSGSDAALNVVQNATDLVTVDPSLTYNGGHYGSPTIRGIGSLISTPGSQVSVPIYVDGVLLLASEQYLFAFNNISQIEVLKGPQGTLFGRNANGGVINITTRDPDQVTQADISAGIASYATADANFYGNAALADDLSANLAVNYHDQGEGYGRNVTTGKNAYFDRSIDVRGKLGWTPDAKTSIVLTTEYSHDYSGMVEKHLLQGTIAAGGVLPSQGFFDPNDDFPSYTKTTIYSGSLRVSTDFNFATFRSITAYTDLRQAWPYDTDGGPTARTQGPISEYTYGLTQELQLVSPDTQRLKWVVGLYYMNMNSGLDPLTLMGSSFGANIRNLYGNSNAVSEAIFAQATYAFPDNILPNTELTLGGRYTSDQRTVDGHVDINNVRGAEAFQRANFAKPTYRIALDHHLSDAILVYASMSSSYNAGQFNVTNLTAPAVLPEVMTAYEAGFKSGFFDNRLQLNGAAFWYNYKDLQVTVLQNFVSAQSNAAAARVRGAELSLDAVPVDNLNVHAGLSYTDAVFTSYPNAQFFTPLPAGGYASIVGNATGNPLLMAPTWGFDLSANYQLSTDIGAFVFAGSYSFKSRYFFDYQDVFAQPETNLVNASITFRPDTAANWDVMLWGKNLTDQKSYARAVVSNNGIDYSPNPPLTVGASLHVHI